MDLISRQAAIAVADSSDYVGLSVEDVKKVTDEVVKGLKRLPSEQPEHTETHSCDYERTGTHDLVSRDAVINAILQLDNLIYTVPDYIDAVRSVPSAEPESRREWYMKGYRDAQNAALHESCTDCPLYDHDRHNCPRFNKVIPTAIRDAQPRWISCEERLPEEDTDVLVTVYFAGLTQTSPSGWKDHIKPSYYVDVARYLDENWSSYSDEYKVAANRHKVVAWMPLPEPYKEGQE